MIKLLLVDDQVLFIETLKTVIELRAPEIQVVGLAYNGEDALEAVKDLNPDIILMDVRMPVMDGVKAAREIHKRYPEIRIMMLTTFDDDAYVHDALEGGAVGYLLKNMPSEDLIRSIQAINSGTVQISPDIAAHLLAGTYSEKPESRKNLSEGEVLNYSLDNLSRREREILYLMSRGYDNNSISEKLFIAEQTVKNHISHVYRKLNLHDRMSVMKAARNSELKEYCRYLLDDE